MSQLPKIEEEFARLERLVPGLWPGMYTAEALKKIADHIEILKKMITELQQGETCQKIAQ